MQDRLERLRKLRAYSGAPRSVGDSTLTDADASKPSLDRRTSASGSEVQQDSNSQRRPPAVPNAPARLGLHLFRGRRHTAVPTITVHAARDAAPSPPPGSSVDYIPEQAHAIGQPCLTAATVVPRQSASLCSPGGVLPVKKNAHPAAGTVSKHSKPRESRHSSSAAVAVAGQLRVGLQAELQGLPQGGCVSSKGQWMHPPKGQTDVVVNKGCSPQLPVSQHAQAAQPCNEQPLHTEQRRQLVQSIPCAAAGAAGCDTPAVTQHTSQQVASARQEHGAATPTAHAQTSTHANSQAAAEQSTSMLNPSRPGSTAVAPLQLLRHQSQQLQGVATSRRSERLQQRQSTTDHPQHCGQRCSQVVCPPERLSIQMQRQQNGQGVDHTASPPERLLASRSSGATLSYLMEMAAAYKQLAGVDISSELNLPSAAEDLLSTPGPAARPHSGANGLPTSRKSSNGLLSQVSSRRLLVGAPQRAAEAQQLPWKGRERPPSVSGSRKGVIQTGIRPVSAQSPQAQASVKAQRRPVSAHSPRTASPNTASHNPITHDSGAARHLPSKRGSGLRAAGAPWRSGPRDPAGTLIPVSDRPVLCCSVDPCSGNVAVGCADHAVYVLFLTVRLIGLLFSKSSSCKVNSAAQQLFRTLYGKRVGHTEWVTSVTYLPDGRVASGAMDGKICLWDRGVLRATELQAHTAGVSVLACAPLNPSTLLVSGGYDSVVYCWTPARSGRQLPQKLLGHKAAVLQLVLCEGRGGAASGDRQGSVLAWDTCQAFKSCWTAQAAHQGHVTALSQPSNVHTLLSGGQDGTLCCWDLRVPGAQGPAHRVPLHNSNTGRGALGNIVLLADYDSHGRRKVSITPRPPEGRLKRLSIPSAHVARCHHGSQQHASLEGGEGQAARQTTASATDQLDTSNMPEPVPAVPTDAAVPTSHPSSQECYAVTSGADGCCCVSDARMGYRRVHRVQLTDFPYSMEGLGSGLVAVGCGDGSVHVVDAVQGKTLYALGADGAAVRGLGRVGNKLVCCGDGGAVMLYDFAA